MLPPKTLLQPAWSHSQPSQSLATSQIQAALLDPNSHLENAGSSMYTGALDGRPLAVLAMARPPPFLHRAAPCRSGNRVPRRRRPVMGRTARARRDLRPWAVVVAGADVAMMTSALLRNGPDHLRPLETQVRDWMDRHGFETVERLRGRLSQRSVPDPAAFERANYIKTLASHGVPGST